MSLPYAGNGKALMVAEWLWYKTYDQLKDLQSQLEDEMAEVMNEPEEEDIGAWNDQMREWQELDDMMFDVSQALEWHEFENKE